MRFSLFFLAATFFVATLHASYGPWGHDAELTSPPPPCHRSPSALQRLAQGMIGIHHCVISPVDGPRSHFTPSSSHYTEEAICKYGFVRGFLMGCDRLTRENDDPWIYPTTCVDGRALKIDCP